MHLGTLLTKLRCENDAQLALAALGDSSLFGDIVSVGAAFGETPAQYVASSAARFASRASNEEWLQLMSSLERSADAGNALVSHVVRWALRTDQHSMAQAASSGEIESGC